ncbi:MAG: hypothetical protein AAF517_04580 [Planctomycetota bacterium]
MRRAKIIAAILVAGATSYLASRWLLFVRFDVRSEGHPEAMVYHLPMGTAYSHPEVFAVYSVGQDACEAIFAPIDSLHLAIRRRRGAPDPDRMLPSYGF